MAAGCTFVAVSRLWSLEDGGAFEPISLQRLSSISCGRNIQTRSSEEVHLQHLAEITMQQSTACPSLAS